MIPRGWEPRCCMLRSTWRSGEAASHLGHMLQGEPAGAVRRARGLRLARRRCGVQLLSVRQPLGRGGGNVVQHGLAGGGGCGAGQVLREPQQERRRQAAAPAAWRFHRLSCNRAERDDVPGKTRRACLIGMCARCVAPQGDISTKFQRIASVAGQTSADGYSFRNVFLPCADHRWHCRVGPRRRYPEIQRQWLQLLQMRQACFKFVFDTWEL